MYDDINGKKSRLVYKYFKEGELVNNSGLHPWDILPGETSLAYKYFTMFIDMGPERRITDMKKRFGDKLPSYSRLKQISSENDWYMRARMRDSYVLQAKTDALKHKYNEFVLDKIDHKMASSLLIDALIGKIYNNPKLTDDEKIRAIKAAVIADSTNDAVLNNYVGNPTERVEIMGRLEKKENKCISFTDEEQEFIADFARNLVKGG